MRMVKIHTGKLDDTNCICTHIEQIHTVQVKKDSTVWYFVLLFSALVDTECVCMCCLICGSILWHFSQIFSTFRCLLYNMKMVVSFITFTLHCVHIFSPIKYYITCVVVLEIRYFGNPKLNVIIIEWNVNKSTTVSNFSVEHNIGICLIDGYAYVTNQMIAKNLAQHQASKHIDHIFVHVWMAKATKDEPWHKWINWYVSECIRRCTVFRQTNRI